MNRQLYSLRRLARLGALALTLSFAACDDSIEQKIVIGGGDGNPEAPAGGAPASRMEVPEMLPGNTFIAHWTKENGDSVMTYCLEYSAKDCHSRWVAFRFDGKTRAKKVERKPYEVRPQYPRDPLLPGNVAALDDDVSFRGYEHGHLCASADRLYSRTANDNTFYMTNMSPQIGRFNSPYWSGYEGHVQKLGRNAGFADTLYVVRGGTIALGQTLGRAANGKITIPKYYYMALLKVKNNAYSAIAFWVEHKDYGNYEPSNGEKAAHTISINELEERTGINFFPQLPDAVENAVEQQCMPTAWQM